METADTNIVEKINEKIISERRSYAPRCNYVSGAGHPCARKMVYDRLNWQEKALPGLKAAQRMEVGRKLEDYAIDQIRAAGVTVVEQQRPMEWPKLELSGRIEGQIKVNSFLILFEVKSVKQWDFEAINTAEDLKKSMKWWIRGYYDSFQLYLLLMSQEKGLFFLVSLEGEIKQFVVELDYEHAEKVVKKLETVNKHVKEKTYPDRITDRKICSMCDHRATCLPDELSDSMQIESSQDLIEMLERREKLQESAKLYEALDEDVKKIMKPKGPGEYLAGDFQIKIFEYDREFINVPEEIKEKYRQSKRITKIDIVKIK